MVKVGDGDCAHFEKSQRLESGSSTYEVIVLGRIPFLQKGILAQLAQATNGIGVIMEHRYYGGSLPTPDFSNKSLRFLTTEQALADTAYFSKNIKFPGLEKYNLTAPGTAHIVYGGSYAGGQVVSRSI